jgi:hypothetical protein
MSVEYEWNIDADSAAKQAAAAEAPRRSRCRVPLIVVGALVLAAALTTYVVWRLGRASVAEASSAVLAVVDLEQRALEAGDRELFLELQDEADAAWMEAQRQRAAEGSPLPPPFPEFIATEVLTIERPAIFGDQAEVAVVRLAGRPGGEKHPFRSATFYRLLPDGRWVHTAPDSDHAGRPLLWVGPRNDLAGYLVDSELIEQLAPDLELTADRFCTLLECVPEQRFRLALTGTLAAGSQPPGVLPAPHIVGAPVTEEANAIWRNSVQSELIDVMIGDTVGVGADVLPGGLIADALRTQVKAYLGVESPHQTDPTSLAGALEAGQIPSIAELWDDDIDSQERTVADDAAAVLVRYIEQEYGRQGVVALLMATAYTTDPGSLFAIGLSADADLIEQAWLEFLAGQITPEAALPIAAT